MQKHDFVTSSGRPIASAVVVIVALLASVAGLTGMAIGFLVGLCIR